MKIKFLCVVVMGLLLGGCSAHNAFIIKNTTDTHTVSEKKFKPHNDKVFISADSLPADAYELIGIIDIGKIWYGSTANVLESMAVRGRELGADAVIEVKTWHQPSGFSWAAPHGSGKAVKYIDKTKIDYSKLKGDFM
jgi:uncharacterized protein YbjQ (UPF0145 family)